MCPRTFQFEKISGSDTQNLACYDPFPEQPAARPAAVRRPRSCMLHLERRIKTAYDTQAAYACCIGCNTYINSQLHGSVLPFLHIH